jgi:hypothetical protein
MGQPPRDERVTPVMSRILTGRRSTVTPRWVPEDRAAWAVAWGGVVGAAFVNGALHRGYAPVLGEPTATRLSELVLPVLVVPWALRVERRHPLTSATGALAVGVLWASATVTFEFLFGHYVNGDSWETLRAAYRLADGRLWSLDVAVVAAAPALARGWHRRQFRKELSTP